MRLTEEQVIEIYTSSTPANEIAKKMKIDANKVYKVRLGITYSNITENLTPAEYEKHVSPHYWGEKNPRAKLTNRQAAAIKRSKRPLKELAEKYGVDFSVVYNIRTGKRWKHLK